MLPFVQPHTIVNRPKPPDVSREEYEFVQPGTIEAFKNKENIRTRDFRWHEDKNKYQWHSRPVIRGFEASSNPPLPPINVVEWAEKIGGLLPDDLEATGQPHYVKEFVCKDGETCRTAYCYRPDDPCGGNCCFICTTVCFPFAICGYVTSDDSTNEDAACGWSLKGSFLKTDGGALFAEWRKWYLKEKLGQFNPRPPAEYVNGPMLMYYWFGTRPYRYREAGYEMSEESKQTVAKNLEIYKSRMGPNDAPPPINATMNRGFTMRFS